MDTFEFGRVHPSAVVSADAELGSGVTVGAFTVVHAGVVLGDGAVVGSHCVLGEPTADEYDRNRGEPAPLACRVGDRSIIRSHTVIYRGVTIGPDLQTGHRVTIREGSEIGTGVRIGTLGDLQGDLRLGDHVRLHSNVFVSQLSVVEDFVWLFPRVTLTNDPHPPSDSCLRGVTVRRFAVVAAGVLALPGVEIGENALVGARSLVTRDVPAAMVALGSPAEIAGPVADVRCRHDALGQVYPWPVQFRRGYPDGALPDPDELTGA